jgi:hypothetical protein
MTLLLLWGYALSTVAILIAFSTTNQRAGWKKNRIATSDIFDHLPVDAVTNRSVSSASVRVAPLRTEEFSSQLLNLSSALSSYISTPVQVISKMTGELTMMGAGRESRG